jgi:hypothetical protein
MPDYVFLTGHRKSGTTMLRGLFDGHKSATTYPSDVGLLYAYFPAFTLDGARSDDELRERIPVVLKKSLAPVHGTEHAGAIFDTDEFIKLFWAEFGNGDLRSRGDIVDALGKAWCRYSKLDPGKTTVVLKETSQSVFFDELKADFPSLKMIHLVRDPRDNYAALKVGVARYYSKLGENELETLASLINRCRMDMISARLNSARHPESFLALRFEDVVADPKPSLVRACAFLGWEYSDTMLSPTILGSKNEGNSHEGKRFSGISGENAGAWRSRISEDEAKIVEYWCEREMLDWGYEPAFDALERQKAFAAFYEWYNSRYFFADSFAES